MAGNGISINWGGFKDAVDEASSNISDTQGLMTKIGVAMKGHTVRRFAAGVDPDGNAWKPSGRVAGTAASDKKRDSKGRFLTGSGRKGKKGSGQTLVDTGRLRNSISFSASPLDVHVGSNVVYARIHQLGGKAGRNHKVTIPARPYLGLSEEDQKEIEALVKDHLEGSFKK